MEKLNVNVGDFILFRMEISGSQGVRPMGQGNATVLQIFVAGNGQEVYRTDFTDNAFQAVYQDQVIAVYKPKGE